MELQSNASRVHASSSRPRISIDVPVARTVSNSRQADLTVGFLIVGGGIAGLATAYALAAAGHRVHVLERSSGLHQPAGGIRIPPNCTKVLAQWGLLEELARRGSPCPVSKLLDLHTGESLGVTDWHRDLVKEMGEAYYMVHHQDLHEILFDLAVSAGVRVSFSTTVEAVTPPRDAVQSSVDATTLSTIIPSTSRPSVTLASGETLHADVVIGADGPYSMVRRVVAERMEERRSGLCVYSGTLSTSEMRADPRLQSLLEEGWPMFLGNQRSIIGYPIRNDQEFAIHIWWDEDDPNTSDTWTPTVHVSSLPGYSSADIDPRARIMLDKVGLLSRMSFVDRDRPESWIDRSERVALIGEAAHPIMPCNHHSAAISIEDAAVFGTLFSHLHSHAQISTLLYGFQDLRQPRATALNLIELHNASVALSGKRPLHHTMVRLEAGPSDGEMQEDQWAEVAEVWGYDANDAAEEWWMQWGVLRERAEATSAQ